MGIFSKNKAIKTYYLNHENGLDGFPRTATKVTLDEEKMNITFSQLVIHIFLSFYYTYKTGIPNPLL